MLNRYFLAFYMNPASNEQLTISALKLWHMKLPHIVNTVNILITCLLQQYFPSRLKKTTQTEFIKRMSCIHQFQSMPTKTNDITSA